MTQLRIPGIFMRGGTSKGVFFVADDLPQDAAARERILLRVIGSPDRYGKHIDGMGGASSSTSKVVLVSRSLRPDCDVDYLFGAVAVDQPAIDWSGNCGNLSAAVGPFAIHAGLIDAPADGVATVRIWQQNIARRIVAHVPMLGGKVQETGDFELDGVTFPAAEIQLEFLDPGASDGSGLFPTGSMIDTLVVPGLGEMPATLINAGNPTIFIAPSHLGLSGAELPGEINADPDRLAHAEAIRAAGAVAMGLVATAAEATRSRPHTPKLALVAPPATYVASDGKQVLAADIQLLVRIFSMGQMHHAMTGTGAVTIAAAAAIPGTLVHRVTTPGQAGLISFGHPSGTLRAGAEAQLAASGWVVSKVMMSRSARILMEGWVRVPAA